MKVRTVHNDLQDHKDLQELQDHKDLQRVTAVCWPHLTRLSDKIEPRFTKWSEQVHRMLACTLRWKILTSLNSMPGCS